MDLIKPNFKYRFVPKGTLDWHGSLEAAFERGDFVLCTEFAENGSELQCNSFILSGLVRKGLQRFEALKNSSSRTRLIAAYGYWQVGNFENAQLELDKIGEEDPLKKSAVILREALLGQQIDVFQTIEIPGKKFDVSETKALSFGNFVVKPIGTQISYDADQYELNTSIATYLANKGLAPDFSFLLTPFNHWLCPMGIENLKIPTVRWHHDNDNHIHRSFDNYRIYDVNIMCTSQEHFETSTISDSFCSTNLTLQPNDTVFTKHAISNNDRKIDVLLSGAVFNEFHSEKSCFAYQLLELADDYNITLVDGYLPNEDYTKLMRNSKFVPIVNRHCGANSPRWHETLEQEALLLYPLNSGYGKITTNAIAISDEFPAADIKKHIENHRLSKKHKSSTYSHKLDYSDLEEYMGPFEVRFESFLKHCFFLIILKDHLNWRIKKETASKISKPKSRLVWSTPSVDTHYNGEIQVFHRVHEIVERLKPEKDWDERDFNNAGMLNFRLAVNAKRLAGSNLEENEYVKLSEDLLKNSHQLVGIGLGQFPKSLLLQFNSAYWRLIWNALHGLVYNLENLRNSFTSLIETEEKLNFHTLGSDIGCPENFHHDKIFPYFTYGQIALSEEVQKRTGLNARTNVKGSTRNLIVSTMHAAIGWTYIMEGNQNQGLKHLSDGWMAFPENQRLSSFIFDLLLENIESSDKPHLDEIEKCIEMFLHCVNFYPVQLIKHGGKVIPMMKNTRFSAYVEPLTNDWLRLLSMLHKSTFINYFPKEGFSNMVENQKTITNFLRQKPKIKDKLIQNLIASNQNVEWLSEMDELPLRREIFNKILRTFYRSLPRF